MSLRLSIVIVHYNTPEDLGRCLDSLQAQAPACEHETVVIDNASTAPGLDALQDRFPQVRWVRNAENLGYGRACNQGMALALAEYHLILNPDIVVLEGAIDAALAFAERNPRAGIIGPQLLNEDGTVQESCRRFYTLWTLLMRRTLLGKLVPNSRTVARHLMRDFDHQSVRPVDWVLGGCLLVRREALARCGPMDDRFFLYFEDVDWCYRMWQCGYEVVYLPGARFVHRHRRSSAKGALNRSFWLHLTSLISFYEKWSLVVYMAKKWRRPVEVGLHWLLDMVLLAGSLVGAYALRWLAGPLFDEELLRLSWYLGWAGWAGLIVTAAFALMGRYGGPTLRRGLDWGSHLRQMGMVALLLLAGSYLGRDQVVSRAVLVIFLGLFSLSTAWALHLVHGLHRRLTRGYLNLERTLLVGPPEALATWLASVADPRALGIDVVGYVDAGQAAPTRPPLGRGEVPWLGRPEALADLVERFRVSQVAFWERPQAAAPIWATLAGLRRRRIRLRWILDEAWLLAVGARADAFGPSPSGVLDPDDRLALRRGVRRPVEIIVGALLVLVGALLTPWRRWRGRQGLLRDLAVDIGDGRDDHGTVSVATDAAGWPRPIWWQLSLAVALMRGWIGITGAPLRRGDAPVDPSRYLIDLEAQRPGLTGRWTDTESGPGRFASRWRTFFMNPGGLGRPASSPAMTAPRGSGEEEQRS